jgi:hypothetical protein
MPPGAASESTTRIFTIDAPAWTNVSSARTDPADEPRD